jgi:Flp pilus assembly protein TadB
MTDGKPDRDPGRDPVEQGNRGGRRARDRLRQVRDRVDLVAFRLFGRHVDSTRHERDRTRYAGLHRPVPFETYLIRLYALSWVLAVIVGIAAGVALHATLPQGAVETVQELPILDGIPADWVLPLVALLGGGLAGLATRLLLRRLGSGFIGARYRRRRARIEETLPGAVRYLHVAATGTVDPRVLLERVASRPRIHGATARSFAAIRSRQRLGGSIDAAIRRVARDTPAQDSLAPFLLTFLERRRAGNEALREFLADESRLLAVEDEHRHKRAGAFLRTVVGLFVVLLVGPVVVGLGLVGGLVVVPGVGGPDAALPVPDLTGATTAIGGGAIVLLGAGAALFAFLLRPSGLRWALPAPSQSPWAVLRTSPSNPTNALLVVLPLGVAVLGWGLLGPADRWTALLGAYVTVAVPVGLVDARRARQRARRDRALPAFVHSLADRLESGVPVRRAVARIASEESHGPLDEPIRKLAADLKLIQGPEGGRKRALERFVGRLGTPFAGRTVGLAIGAIEAGADARSAVSHLQTETGRLEHADRARRNRFPAMVLVGWTVGLLLVAIVVVVNLMVVETASPTGPVAGIAVEPLAGVSRERPLFFLLTQATMLASGWFAGLTGRGLYEALLHSGVLLAIAWVGFRLAGLG